MVPIHGGPRFFIATVAGESGAVEPHWDMTPNTLTRDGEEVWQCVSLNKKQRKIGKEYNFNLVLYNGTETQLPDPSLESLVGAGQQSAYRGLVYIVLPAFDEANYGNRIPNFEAEIVNFDIPVEYSPDANNVPFSSIASDPQGKFAYSFRNDQIDGPLGPGEHLFLYKVSLSDPQVLATSVDLGYGGALLAGTSGCNVSDQVTVSWDGTLIYDVLSQAPTPSNGLILVLNASDLSVNRLINCTGAFSPGQTGGAVDKNNTMLAGVEYFGFGGSETQGIAVCELATGAVQWIDIGTIGGPAFSSGVTIGFQPCFDANGYLWVDDDHGSLWKVTIARVGGILQATAAVGFVIRPNDGSDFGSETYSPLTGYINVFQDKGSGSDSWAIRFDPATNTVVDTNTITDGTWNTFGTSAEMTGIHNGPWVALTDNPTTPGEIGTYNLVTGATVYYDYRTTWNIDKPDDLFNSGIAISFDGTDVTNANSGTQDFWFFPLNPHNLNLDEILADISEELKIDSSRYDFSALASVIPTGIVLLDRQRARDFIESLIPAYFFDLFSSGGKILGALRSDSAISFTIPDGDLGASESNEKIVDKLSITRVNDLEIPRDLSINYYDYLHDYISGSTPEVRMPITSYSSGKNQISVPCVMMPGDAVTAAKRMVTLSYVERNTIKFSLPLDYIGITPSDVGICERGTEQYEVRVTKINIQPTKILDVEAVSEDLGTYSLQVPAPGADLGTGSFPPGGGTINQISEPLLEIMDTAALQQSDLTGPGVYAVGSVTEVGGTFGNETVMESSDDSTFDPVATITNEAVICNCNGTLRAWTRAAIWDNTNTLNVTVINGQLASAAYDDVTDSFANLAWLSNGEIIQFLTATLEGDGSYTISGLLRGRFGTEIYMGTHAANEELVMLDPNTVVDIAMSNSDINATRYWQGQNASPVNGETPVQTLTMAMRRLRPRAPYYMKGSRDGGGNLTVTGLNRMRWRGQPLWIPPETDAPATMQVDILNGVDVVRTITAVASPNGSVISDPSGFSFVYKAADQVLDFGSVQADISLNAYKLNSLVGRGDPGNATL